MSLDSLLGWFSNIGTSNQIGIFAIIATIAAVFLNHWLQKRRDKQNNKLEEKIQQLTAEGIANNDAIKQLVEQGKFKEAEKLALENKTKNDLLLFRLSYLQEQYQQAIHRGKTLLSSDYQGDAGFYFMLGTAYIFLEQYDKAISNLAEAIKLKRDYADAHYGIGIVYHKKGEYDKAIASYNQVLTIDSNDENAKKGLELMKKLKAEQK
jgi:tetratricopeptide (TPR) repeat protein